MFSKKSKILSVILTVIMIVCIIPVSASAAKVTLTVSDQNMVLVPPTVTPLEFDYGTTYGELTVTGGSITYKGEAVEGTFVLGKTTGWESKVIAIPMTAAQKNLTLYFIPTDTATYGSSVTFTYRTDYPVENWPVINVIPRAIEVVGDIPEFNYYPGQIYDAIQPTSSMINVCYKGTTDAVPNGIFGWSEYDFETMVPSYYGDKEVTESCTRNLIFFSMDCGYNSIPVKINLLPAAEIATAPTAANTSLSYEQAENMTLADIALSGGEATYKGVAVTGSFEWAEPDTKLTDYAGLGNKEFDVKFVPDNADYAEDFADVTVAVACTMPGKRQIPITFTGDTISVPKKTATSINAKDVLEGIEISEDFDGEILLSWRTDLSGKTSGVTNNITITATVVDDASYADLVVTKNIKVDTIKIEGAYGTFTVEAVEGGEEGEIKLTLTYSSQHKGGYVDIRETGVLVENNIAPTYIEGKEVQSYVVTFIAPKTGRYSFVARYNPSADDTATYSLNTIAVSIDVVVREKRTITVKGGTASADYSYVGEKVTVEAKKAKNFKGWEIKDADGNAVSASELGVTDAQLLEPTLEFTMPDFDITIKSASRGFFAMLIEFVVGIFNSIFSIFK